MQEITKMNDTELATFIRDKRAALREARFNAAARDPHVLRTTKREIARALTEQTRRVTANA